MADVDTIPKIRCDNCGLIAEKHKGQFDKSYSKPRIWGSCRMEGGRSTDSYGGKGRLDFADLCPQCANAAADAAAEALKARREDNGK
ncbi:hypothetical protein MesoLjLc_50930 [Mesorhizobium sp. L-8-10]|uniref:hypothetical protein n=1 Tax=Mesorhizobium sp. L-8-10 TaxID=2744523 RepID=UPI001925F912|nr:hypothetical protein [Mesorhizobium sp. L-8-10]BCH33163.1 hypothetical protein MesoLjLc_50930 [Mesorhizobium sp. L-8-10]